MKNPDFEKFARGKQRNLRVGVLPAKPYNMGVGFRTVDDATYTMVQRWYRSQFFTQAELARIFDISVGTINKICRAVPAEGASISSMPRRRKKDVG